MKYYLEMALGVRFYYCLGKGIKWTIQLDEDDPEEIFGFMSAATDEPDLPTNHSFVEVGEAEVKSALQKAFPDFELPPWLLPSHPSTGSARRCEQCNAPLKPNASPLARFCNNKNVCKMAWRRANPKDDSTPVITKKIAAFDHVILSVEQSKWLQINCKFDGFNGWVEVIVDRTNRYAKTCQPVHLKATLLECLHTAFRERQFNTEHMRNWHLETATGKINIYFEQKCPFKAQLPPKDDAELVPADAPWTATVIDFKWLVVAYGQYLNEAGKLSTFVKFAVDADEGKSQLQNGEKHDMSHLVVCNAQDIERTVMSYISKVFKVRAFVNDSIRQAHLKVVSDSARKHFEENKDPRLKALLRLPSQPKQEKPQALERKQLPTAAEIEKRIEDLVIAQLSPIAWTPTTRLAIDIGGDISQDQILAALGRLKNAGKVEASAHEANPLWTLPGNDGPVDRKKEQEGLDSSMAESKEPVAKKLANLKKPGDKLAIAAENKRFEMIVIETMKKEDWRGFDYAPNYLWSSSGYDVSLPDDEFDHYQEMFTKAFKRLQKRGVIEYNGDKGDPRYRLAATSQPIAPQKPANGISKPSKKPAPTESAVLALLQAGELEPIEIAKALTDDPAKYINVRSLINQLYIKNAIARRRKDGKSNTWSYAIPEYYRSKGIAHETSNPEPVKRTDGLGVGKFIVPAGSQMSLTAKVLAAFKDCELDTAELVVKLVDVPAEKFNSVRSTVNILYLKGTLWRRKSPTKENFYNYAFPEWYQANGIDAEKGNVTQSVTK